MTVWSLSGSIAAGGLAAAMFVSLPLMATFQTCLKFKIDGMAASAWVFLAIVAFLGRPTPPSRCLLLGVGIASGLTAWTGVIFSVLTSGAICVPGVAGRDISQSAARRAAGLLVLGVGVAVAVLCAAFAWQRGGVAAFGADLESAFRTHANRAGFTNRAWCERQASYGWLGYGPLGLLSLGLGFGILAKRLGRLTDGVRPVSDGFGLLHAFLAVSLATGVIWTIVFREGSYIHEYWSLPTCMGVAAVIPLLCTTTPSRHRTPAFLCAGAVVLATYLMSWQVLTERFAGWRGQGNHADVTFLKTQRGERFRDFVFLPLGDHPFNGWFHTRLFEYYTDRPLRLHEPGSRLTSDDRLILLAYDDQASAETFVERKFGVRLRHRGCGPRFCTYELRVIPAGDAGAASGAYRSATAIDSLIAARRSLSSEPAPCNDLFWEQRPPTPSWPVVTYPNCRRQSKR